MREILFRGKSVDNNEWVYGYLIKGATRFVIQKSIAQYPQYDVIPETIGQYTGLTDKYGKKIFEGDLVKHEWDGEPYIVHFKEDRGGYSPFANDGGCGCCCDCDFTGVEGIEIVGNIYDKEVE